MVCGSVPSDPCHIKTFKVSQSDHPANIVSMCRNHHQEQHKIGWKRMIAKYSSLGFALELKGWVFHLPPFDENKVIITHPEVK